MKKFAAFLFLFLLLAAARPAEAALTIDGSASAATVATVTLTTTKVNDVIILYVGAGNAVTAVSDVAGLTWIARVPNFTGSSGLNSSEWYAISTGVLTSDVITVTGSVTSRLTAFGINGANLATPFDTNVGVPATATSASASTLTATISTTNPSSMLLGLLRLGGAGLGTLTRPSGFGLIVSAGTAEDVSNNIVAAAQSSVGETFSWTAGSQTATLIVDAIQAAPTAGGMLMTIQ